MTTDIHAHIIPEDFIAVLASEVPAARPTLASRADGWYFTYPDGRVSGPVPAGMFDVAARLTDMDKAGVDVQALSVPPPHFQYRLEPAAAAVHARLYNDSIVVIVRAHPDRFVALGTLPMQDVGVALAELDRLVAIPEVVGLELATNVAGTNLWATKALPRYGRPSRPPGWLWCYIPRRSRVRTACTTTICTTSLAIRRIRHSRRGR